MEEVIKYFGGKSAMARALGVEPAAVTWWLQNGLPAFRAIQIERVTNGKFMARDLLGIKEGGK